LLESLERAGARRALVGGDFNASTFDLSGPLAIARDVLHKLIVTGFRRTLDGLMRPEARYERPLFELLARRGFAARGFNDRGAGTYTFDFHDAYSEEKLRQAGGRPLVWLVQRILRRWQGRLPARLDWFAGRGLGPVAAGVTTPLAADGRPVSD